MVAQISEITICACEKFPSACSSNQLLIPSIDDCVDDVNTICDECLCISPSNNESLSEDEQSDIEKLHSDRFVTDIITWVKECKPPGKSVDPLLQICPH